MRPSEWESLRPRRSRLPSDPTHGLDFRETNLKKGGKFGFTEESNLVLWVMNWAYGRDKAYMGIIELIEKRFSQKKLHW